jgi:hypothetical protein
MQPFWLLVATIAIGNGRIDATAIAQFKTHEECQAAGDLRLQTINKDEHIVCFHVDQTYKRVTRQGLWIWN